MNSEFHKRQAQVFDILEKLSAEARKEKKEFVFIGGSAVQVTLSKPVRLSIDLDAYYSGDSAKLLECLKPEFEVGKRVSRDEQFEFFEARKEGVLVKIDLAKFSVLETQFGQKTFTSSQGGTFRASVAVPEYLLAAKLSALAIGTIGRRQGRKDFQIDFLKDVTDASCLIELVKPSARIWEHMGAVIRTENSLRKTGYAFEQVMESARDAVLKSIQTEDNEFASKGTLQNFSQYLFGKPIRKPDYWEMAAKVAAYAAVGMAKPLQFSEVWKTADSHVQKEYAVPQKVAEWQAGLAMLGVDRNLLHELKILSPKALGYYYYARFAEQAMR